MIKKIISAFKAGFLWYKFLTAYERDDLNEALGILDRIPRSRRFSVRIDLMKSQIFNEQFRAHECYTLSKSLISKINSSSKLDEHTKLYCATYAQWLMQINEKKVYPDRSFLVDVVKPEILQAIELNQVSSDLKKNFPLRIHHDWYENKIN